MSDTARGIANTLTNERLTGSKILELGCGFGALTLELIRRGASEATGVDLSPKMIQTARLLAEEEGMSKSVSFLLGDGAVSRLDKSDIVILDSVICCYPDYSTLVGNSSAAAGRYYAISLPDDTRFATRLIRIVLPLQRLIFRKNGFTFFIHPTRKISELLEKNGFSLHSKSHVGWVWSIFVFRPGT